jgi:hypothetical protein
MLSAASRATGTSASSWAAVDPGGSGTDFLGRLVRDEGTHQSKPREMNGALTPSYRVRVPFMRNGLAGLGSGAGCALLRGVV